MNPHHPEQAPWLRVTLAEVLTETFVLLLLVATTVFALLPAILFANPVRSIPVLVLFIAIFRLGGRKWVFLILCRAFVPFYPIQETRPLAARFLVGWYYTNPDATDHDPDPRAAYSGYLRVDPVLPILNASIIRRARDFSNTPRPTAFHLGEEDRAALHILLTGGNRYRLGITTRPLSEIQVDLDESRHEILADCQFYLDQMKRWRATTQTARFHRWLFKDIPSSLTCEAPDHV